jgi:glyoxylase-like metal-dependent hydrolase (beta-lactamase superfamily II)
MTRVAFAIALAALAIATPAFAQTAPAQPAAAPAAQQPAYGTRKVEGTDNVYIFRYGNAQSMFVVTPAGVIATDPIGYARRDAPQVYVSEIRKVTDQPIRYLIYSHHHFDHIAGGKAFKDAGATIIAHQRVKDRLAVLNDPYTPLPDETVGNNRTISLGGTTLELHYLGLNHSSCACRKRKSFSSSTRFRSAASPAAALSTSIRSRPRPSYRKCLRWIGIA